MKRWIACLACLLMLSGSALGAVSIRMEDTAALLETDGAQLVAPGVYGDIVPLGNGLFAAETDGLYALMDGGGNCLTEAVFSALRCEGGLILAEREGKWGLLHPDGSDRSGFEYSLILPGASGNCWALKDDPDDMNSDKLYRIDPQGRQYATRLYVRAVSRAPSEGLLSVLLRGASLYGYCDALGNMVIPAAYDYAGDFAGGRAAVVVDGKYGAIDRMGNAVVPAEYDFLEISPSGLIIAARSGEGAWVFDEDGKELARHTGEDVYIALVGEGYAVIDSDFLHVFDRNCGLILEAPPEAMVMEGVNGQLIISDGMWGEACVYLSGSDGAALYQNIYPLGTAEGEAVYACMTANVGRYVNDLLGEIQFSTDMDSARYGVINGAGEPLTETAYLSLAYLADDRLLARTEQAWQMIDARGDVLWQHAATQSAEPSS